MSAAHPQVVVAVDVQTNPVQVCREAARLVALTGGHVTVLTVVRFPDGIDGDFAVEDPEAGPINALALVAAEVAERAAPGVRALQAAGATVSVRVEEGEVVPGIWAVARDTSADLVIVGSDLARGLRRVLSQGFTEAILHEASCAVAVVKADRTQEEPKPLAAMQRLVVETMG